MTTPTARAKVVKRFAGGSIALIALSPGGIIEGDPSQGLEAAPWVCWVDSQTFKVRLQKVGIVPEVNPDAPVVSFLQTVDGRGFSKLSLCFDQNARRVVAWTENHSITLSRIGAGNTEERTTWTGEDCVLFWDGWLRDASSGEATDISALYLSVDRKTVFYRLQIENFAIEHIYYALPEAVSLDCVARSGFSLGLWLTTKKNNTFMLVSDNYAVKQEDGVSHGIGLFSGLHTEVVVSRDENNEGMSLTTAVFSGLHTEVVVSRDETNEGMSLSTAVLSGLHTEVVVSRDETNEGMLLSALVQSGAYQDVVVQRDDVSEGVSYSISIIGGNYV